MKRGHNIEEVVGVLVLAAAIGLAVGSAGAAYLIWNIWRS